MNVAVIGNGGREHALARKCMKSSHAESVHVIPGNTGMLMDRALKIYPQWDGSFGQLEEYVRKQKIELIIVGNEAYLERGITDYFENVEGVRLFGPKREGAVLEFSKDFAKIFMKEYDIPTADFITFTDAEEACRHIESTAGPYVIKQDALALGKGVLVTSDRSEALQFMKDSFEVTQKVVLEEFLEGREFSLLAFVNGDYHNCMIPARDYKRAHDGDEGLNTGGMGSYAPVEYVYDEDLKEVERQIIRPTVEGLIDRNIEFCGILYFGLMKTSNGIKVIEYNTRFGDPEAEVLLESMESDLIEAVTATFEKRVYPLKWKEGVTVGVCLASKGYPRNYEKGCEVSIPKDLNCYSMAVEKNGSSYLTNGGRVLFVVKTARDKKEAKTRCYEDVATVHSDNLYFRKDIGL